MDKRSASAKSWITLILLFSTPSGAIDNVSLDIGTLSAQGWKLENVRISLGGIPNRRQQLSLTIEKLTFPKPFDDLKLADIRCTSFSWDDNQTVCEQGRARIDSKRWRSPIAGFSFRISEKSAAATVSGLNLFGGTMHAEITEQARRWQVKLSAQGLDGGLLQRQLGYNPFEIKNGELNFELLSSGVKDEIGDIDLTARLDRLTLQTPDGKAATDTLSAIAKIGATRAEEGWHWNISQHLTGGALYLEPVYLEAGKESIKLVGNGNWEPDRQRVDVSSFAFEHSGTAAISGRASFDARAPFKQAQAAVFVQSDNLTRFSSIYLKPFAEQTDFEGLSLQGRAKAELILNDGTLTNLALNFAELGVHDENGRIAAGGGEGSIYWSNASDVAIPSALSWQKLSLYSLPIGPARLDFSARVNRVELLKKSRLPFLGGNIALNRFTLQNHPEQEPDIYFEGSMNNVSLEQLTSALHWMPLSGTISGRIPGVEYQGDTLKLKGELNIKVFDGNVRIANLASSDLFGDLPTLSAEIELDRLDLDQITRKFEFGGITGRLSGFVKNLQLENWRPVGFYAWFGTPEDDDSRHRISQKAVQNIANIGGGGAADLLSRSFLRFFDTFGYDRIGLGCYLHDGVCQMMGIEAAENGGYRIIKGGGLPRIDVIGYNSRIDWSVLLERLKRVTASDEVIIK